MEVGFGGEGFRVEGLGLGFRVAVNLKVRFWCGMCVSKGFRVEGLGLRHRD